MPPYHRKLALPLLVALALCAAMGGVILGYPLFYRARIYPGVTVQGVEVGGMRVQEATARLSDTLSNASDQTLTLLESERSWQIDWTDVGRSYDWAGTAQAAYRAGRGEPWHRQPVSAWRIRFQGMTVEPLIDPADPDRVKTFVETLAPQIYVAPREPEIHIAATGVTCVPGEAGQALDVEVTSQRVMEALATEEREVEVATVELPPEAPSVEPACSRARSLLSQPFTLLADDPLTNYRVEFVAPTERLVSWLRTVQTEQGFVLEVREAAVKAWLLELGPELEPERVLDKEETLRRTLVALRAGEHQAQCAIQHPETTYVVKPGDTLFDIAYGHGFPQWRLEEANPNVEPSELLVGMELTIPSIDILLPEPLVPDKRIEIDLPEQRLRAYEGDHLAYDFTCSSGMTSTPTIAGQFQVLYKEPQAYAQRWALEMPYFMAIYYEGPDFANGIHELPIRADGQRLWASVLGWPASYGCIILNVGDAQKLYDWAPVGTLVRIEGVAPGTPAYVPTYDEQTADR